MSTATPTRRRRLGALGVVAAAAIGAASLMPAASAAPVDLTAPVTGNLDVNGNAGTLPAGTAFTGTYDDELFTFDGSITYPASSLATTVTDPPVGDVEVGLQITELTPVTGSWDPVAGTAEATTTVSLQITGVTLQPSGAALDVGDSCIFSPIELNLTGTVTDDGAGNDVLNLAHDGFTIPELAANACGPLVTTPLNDAVSGSNNSVSLTVSFAQGQEIPETTTTTTTVPAETTTTAPPSDPPADPPAAAPAAAPVSGSANYTG